MKQVLLRQGQAIVEEIPAPTLQPGCVLVRVDHSCISIGTEMSGLKTSGLPLWKRAVQQPQNVAKAAQMVAAQGVSRTWSMIEGKLAAGNATGYSASGIVIEVGAGIDDIVPGDRVACAGAGIANHAEVICVPRNLTVHVPDELTLADASTVTLGAIALQGVRRAQPTLGESFVVIGLGILGQLTVQFLKANGCRVIGIDLDRSRIETAKKLGMDFGFHPDDGSDIQQVARLTDGLGADGVIITAATPSDHVISTAFQMCRRKGRVVLVGDVGLHLNRADFYQKEIDFLISTSYGPGRYDRLYEEKGMEYPASYVRWTENRNLSEYLRLMAEKRVQIQDLVNVIYPVSQATEAYERLKSGSDKPLMVLLSYPQSGGASGGLSRVALNPAAPKAANANQVRIAVVGAGDFAKGMHLPNIQALKSYHLQAVMSRTGHNATAMARQFGASYSTTDYDQILGDRDVDAVLICTRHNLHAPMTLAALKAGKHVLVEKPLSLTRAELKGLEEFYENGGTPILLTGFNRRFSKYARFIHHQIQKRSNPMILNYRMNAGHIPMSHWVHTEEGGGRNIGEACHIYDLFTYLTGSQVKSVQAHAIAPETDFYGRNDNFVAVMSFEDGSVATLTYTALGAKDYPKEQLEVFVDGKVITLDDYKRVRVAGAKAKELTSQLPEKGQKDEIEAFAESILKGGEWPIPFWQQKQAMEIAFSVEEQLKSR